MNNNKLLVRFNSKKFELKMQNLGNVYTVGPPLLWAELMRRTDWILVCLWWFAKLKEWKTAPESKHRKNKNYSIYFIQWVFDITTYFIHSRLAVTTSHHSCLHRLHSCRFADETFPGLLGGVEWFTYCVLGTETRLLLTTIVLLWTMYGWTVVVEYLRR
jgi:hypothetical protein